MATRSHSKKRRVARCHLIHKPHGAIHPRVQAVGPEHFAIVSVDCAKARSKWMLADFYGIPSVNFQLPVVELLKQDKLVFKADKQPEGGKIWIRMFPHKPITKKPAETRMGKGKGAPEEWVAVVKPGKIMYEMEGVPSEVAREAFRLAARKLPLKTRFVVREE